MSSVHDPIGDIGPEFCRRLDREINQFSRRFSRQMFRIAETSDRFDRAGLIQAECDRLLGLEQQEAARCSI